MGTRLNISSQYELQFFNISGAYKLKFVPNLGCIAENS